MGYDQEMVPKTKDWVERLNPDSKLPNFNTRRILVLEGQTINESFETSNTPESSKDSEAEFLTLLPPLKNLQGASPSSVVIAPLTLSTSLSKRKDKLRYLNNTQALKIQDSFLLTKSVSGTVTVCESKGHNRVIQIRGGVLAESSQSNESSIGVKCNTCGSTVHSTSDHNVFDHFKRGEKIQAAKGQCEPQYVGLQKKLITSLLFMQRHIRERIWYLDNGCSRSMTGVKSYLHKYVEQPGPKFDDKQGTIFNANKEIVLIAPRRNVVYVL
ncbi:hypothetical protein Tco_1371355 [Tanacetum coccineum]